MIWLCIVLAYALVLVTGLWLIERRLARQMTRHYEDANKGWRESLEGWEQTLVLLCHRQRSES